MFPYIARPFGPYYTRNAEVIFWPIKKVKHGPSWPTSSIPLGGVTLFLFPSRQVEALLRDAGALEHRLVNTQQERDQALSHSSDLEAELQRLRADAQDAAGAAARTELLAAERLAAEQEAREERDLAVTRSSELEEEVQRLQAADAQEDKMAADDENVAAERLAAAAETLASEHKEALLERQQQLDRALAEALDLRREVDELRAVREESEGERNSETERLASKHNDSLQERQQELDRALVEAAELRSEAVDLRAGREELEGERNAETERARDEVVVALDEARAEVGVLKERGVEMAEELVTVTREREDGAAVAAGLKEAVDGVRSDLVHVERARDEAVKDKVGGCCPTVVCVWHAVTKVTGWALVSCSVCRYVA